MTMTGPTIGQQLDAKFEELATKKDLQELRFEMHAIVKAAVQEIVQVVNRNTDELREDLNRIGIPVRTIPRRGAE